MSASEGKADIASNCSNVIGNKRAARTITPGLPASMSPPISFGEARSLRCLTFIIVQGPASVSRLAQASFFLKGCDIDIQFDIRMPARMCYSALAGWLSPMASPVLSVMMTEQRRARRFVPGALSFLQSKANAPILGGCTR
jgi:hypothetical protein